MTPAKMLNRRSFLGRIGLMAGAGGALGLLAMGCARAGGAQNAAAPPSNTAPPGEPGDIAPPPADSDAPPSDNRGQTTPPAGDGKPAAEEAPASSAPSSKAWMKGGRGRAAY